MKWLVLRDYGGSRSYCPERPIGPLTKGQVVDLDEDAGAWVNRDSPGVLELWVGPEPEPEPDPELRAVEAPPANRQVRKAKGRKAQNEEVEGKENED